MQETLNKIVNRHMARLLSELTDAGCPALFVDAVKSKLQWMRSDIVNAVKEDYQNEERIESTPANPTTCKG